nr:PREDICTED: protein FAR1-RELATED SEQUENCE 5-like [Daucus carota subsp. sativus]
MADSLFEDFVPRKKVKKVDNKDYVDVDDVVKVDSVVDRVFIDLKDDENVDGEEYVSVDEDCVDARNVVSGDDEVDENVHSDDKGVDNKFDDENEKNKNVQVPYLNQRFDSLDDADRFIRSYALKNGFAVKIQQTKKRAKVDEIYARMFVCRLAGENQEKNVLDEEVCVGSSKGTRRRDKLPRSGCKVRMFVVKKKKKDYWELTTVELEHNHDLVSPSKMTLIQRERHVTSAARNLINVLNVSGIRPSQTMSLFSNMQGGVSNVGFGSQNIRNVVRDERKKKIQVSDAQAGLDLLSRLKEEGGGKFFVKTQVDGENRLKNLVWVDPKCLMAYSNFGDVVAFDTTYRTNRYAMPFVPFTGVNHHYQSVLFGFALMRDEVKSSFEWVLRTWLEAVGDKHPNAIITDQDQAMAGAIASILPQTRHLLCSWHISQKFPEKLNTLYIKHPGTFKVDFNKCIYHSLTEDIFEERWKDLVVKYDLKDHSWLQGLYLLKEKWISAYTKSTFSAGQTTTSRSEGMNAFFDSYVSSSTGLKQFVENAQKAIERQFMREKEEDNDTKNKTRYLRLKTALEQDGASMYTKEMFRQFQVQLVEASKYFVEKDTDQFTSGDEVTHYRCFRPLTEVDKRTMYEVKFNKVALTGRCVCRMYEHLGIPCRHIIAVLNKKNVAQIPVTFIQRRWTRDANRVDGMLPYAMGCDDPTSTELTPSQRFNHMTLLTMSFCHSSMVSKERYEYALEVMNREIANLEKMAVDNVDAAPNTNTENPIEENIGDELNEPVLDPIVSQTKGRKKPQRFKNPIEGLSKKKRKCKQCHEEGHDIRTCKKFGDQNKSS